MYDSALERQVTRLGDLERRILDKVMRHKPVARDTAAEFEQHLTLGERVADRIASFVAMMVGAILLDIARIESLLLEHADR